MSVTVHSLTSKTHYTLELHWQDKAKTVAEVWRTRSYPGYPPPPAREGTIRIKREAQS